MKDDELIHYGVKGMRWGVRKDSYYTVRTARKAYKRTVKELKKSGKANIENLTKARKDYRNVKNEVKKKIKSIDEELKAEEAAKQIKGAVSKVVAESKPKDQVKLMDRIIEIETANRLLRAEQEQKRLNESTVTRIAKDVAVSVITDTAKAKSKKALNDILNDIIPNTSASKKYKKVIVNAIKSGKG